MRSLGSDSSYGSSSKSMRLTLFHPFLGQFCAKWPSFLQLKKAPLVFGGSARASQPRICLPSLNGRFLSLLMSMETVESFMDRGAFKELY